MHASNANILFMYTKIANPLQVHCKVTLFFRWLTESGQYFPPGLEEMRCLLPAADIDMFGLIFPPSVLTGVKGNIKFVSLDVSAFFFNFCRFKVMGYYHAGV